MTTFQTFRVRRGFNEIDELFHSTRKFGTICGGYARYVAARSRETMLAGDIDIFPADEWTSFQSLKSLFVNDKTMVLSKETKFSLLFTSVDTEGSYGGMPPINIIKPARLAGGRVTFGTPEEIIESFAFTISRAALVSPGFVRADLQMLSDEEHKLLRLSDGVKCPASALMFMLKYISRGYRLVDAEKTILQLVQDYHAQTDEYRNEILNKHNYASSSGDNK